MPIPGALQIFGREFSNFEAVLLHNTPVLIDGSDFVDYFGPRDPFAVLWGGEYSSLMIQWRKVLSSFRRCQLDPVFVFSADCELRGQQFAYRVENARRNACALPRPNLPVNDTLLELRLVLLESVLIELLNSEQCPHIRSPYCPRRSCAALSAAMDCPLLGWSPEYFVLSAPAVTRFHNGFTFIPFNLVDFSNPEPLTGSCSTAWPASVKQTCCDAANAKCYFLPAHRFVPELSCLAKVSEFYHPLLFLLLGTDSFPRIKLPAQVYELMNSYVGDYKTRRWYSLCHWLAKFGSNGSMEPIIKILASYGGDLQPAVAERLSEAVLTYIPSPTVASQLAVFLSQNTSLSSVWRSRVDHIPKNQIPLVFDCPRPKRLEWKLQQRLNGTDFGTEVTVDFTSEWPPKLIEAFSQSFLASKYISPIYVSPDVLLPPHLGQLDSDKDVHEDSLPLRLLHYRIFALLKQSSTFSVKSEVKPTIVNEHVNAGSTVMCSTISVNPLHLDFQRDGVDMILSRILGLVIPIEPDDCSPLISLAIALAVWKYRSGSMFPCLPNLAETPLALAVLACAVATYFNHHQVETNESDLYEHYQKVATMAENQASTSKNQSGIKTKVSPAYRLDFVHAFNSLQLVYDSFRSLVALVSALNSSQNKYVLPIFSQTWVIFPSGRLVHWIAACLANVDESTRRHQAIRFWMPRLLYRSETTIVANSAQTLRSMSQEFNKLLDTACSALPDRVPNLDVHFMRCPVPEVDFAVVVPDSASPQKGHSKKPVDQSKQFATHQPTDVSKQDPKSQHNRKGSQSTSMANLNSRTKVNVALRRRFGKTTGYAARLIDRLNSCEAEKTDIH